MIAHVVLFTPKSDLPDATRRELLDALGRAAREIPGIRRFLVGRRVTHGLPGYEQAMTTDYAYAVVVEIDTVDGLKSYLIHPAHLALGRHFTASSGQALAYDFEMLDAREVGSLGRL